MPKVVTMTGSILALGSCSRIIKRVFKVMVAAAFAASAFLVSPACAGEIGVSVHGMPHWLAGIAERSITAVIKNIPAIPAGQQPSSVGRVVWAVSEKIFIGYRITAVDLADGELGVTFEPESELPVWELEIQHPMLHQPASDWFAADIERSYVALKSLVLDLPIEALAWADEGLKEAIGETLKISLPGWKPGLVVQSGKEKTVLQISFTPDLPLILAITPSFSSASLPTLFYDDLKDDLLEQVSVFIGLPVSWAELHERDINAWVEEFLSDKRLVRNTKSKATVSLSPAPVSRAAVSVESSRYTIWGWSAVYGGTTDRSAELGLHLGRKAQIFPGSEIDTELYGEAIMELKEWSVEGRLGIRWMPWNDVWLGGEYSTHDDMLWARVNIEPRLRKPYAWLRVREDGKINVALGWKATEFISFEIHYDSRDRDLWSLRILGNL